MFKSKSLKTFELLTCVFVLVTLVFSPLAKAIELEISGNGEGSSNEVSVQEVSQTEVHQESNSNIQNLVEANANTGQNSLSDNTEGSASVQTGDITSQTSITTQTNTSFAETLCCPSLPAVTISGNGDGSSNKVNLQEVNQTTISVNQNALVTNSIVGYAQTGENVVSNNSQSDISITTGDIKVQNEVTNDPINSVSVKTQSGTLSGVAVLISGNASDTQNQISAEFIFDTEVYLNHSAEIENFIIWEANTGKNSATGNTGGEVTISTGDVDLQTLIRNFANLGGVEIECCDVFDPGRPPAENGLPPGNGGNPPGTDNKSEGGKNENVDTGTKGQLLPSAAAIQAGGPGIIGLSDTSSKDAQAIFFWLSIAMIAFGGRLVVDEILPASYPKRK